MNKRQNLNALNPGQTIEETYLLSRKQILTSKAGNAYGSLRLSDASGEREAKLWERAEELLEHLAVGQVVRVWGKVQAYQGQNQIIITQLQPSPGSDPSQFLPQGPRPAGQLWPEFDLLVKKVGSPHLKRLLHNIFSPAFRPRFALAPAAKAAHHAYVGGLLEHTISVGQLALLITSHYPQLDRDLLLTGALLHDLGKVEEFTLGPPLDYSDAGRLEGHIILGLRQVDAQLAQQPTFPPPLAAAVRHLMLSHHGQEAFGSPQKPKTPEAIVLNMLDDMDAKTNMVQSILAAAKGDSSWSGYHNLLERHIFMLDSQGQQRQLSDAPDPAPQLNQAELSLFKGLTE